MPQYQPTGFDTTGGFQKIEDTKKLGLNILDLFVITILVFVRTKVGYQRLGLGKIYGMTAVLFAVHYILNFRIAVPFIGVVGSPGHSEAFRNYAVVFLFWAIIQRRERYKEFRSGMVWHGLHSGVSHFQFLDKFIRAEWIYKYVDGFACVAVGWLLRYVGITGLGTWAMLGGVGLIMFEAISYEKTEEQIWSIRNKTVDAEIISGMMSGQGPRPAPAQPDSARETKGAPLPTGPDAQLANDIRERQKAAGLPDEPAKGERDEEHPARPAWLADIFAKLNDAARIKIVVAAVILIALVFFGNNLRRASAQLQARNALMAQLSQEKSPTQAAAPPITPVAGLVNAAPVVATAPLQSPGAFLGKWSGQVSIPKQGATCTLSMEIRQEPDDRFSGYPVLGCTPLFPIGEQRGTDKVNVLMQSLLRPLIPSAAILHGTRSKDGIEFQVEKIISTNASGCMWNAGFSVSPFGANQIAANWQDSCGGASGLLTKSR